MKKRRHRLFAVAIAATRLNAQFDQEVSADNDTFTFRRRESVTGGRDAAAKASSPIEFRVGAVSIVAFDSEEACRQGATIAREVFREADGWSNHHAFAAEIAELQTFKKGLG